jgi:integrase
VAKPDGSKAARRTRLEDKDGNPVTTVAQAKAAMEKLKVTRSDADGVLKLAPKRTPIFSEAAREYLEWLKAVGSVKSPKTVQCEASQLRQFNTWGGSLRINQITAATLKEYQRHRSKAGVSGRTVNMGITAVRCVLKHAEEQGLIFSVPQVKELKHAYKSTRLLTEEDIQRLCSTARDKTENGQQLADYILLMAYSGARSSEALSLLWSDVDFDLAQIRFRATETKNGEGRVVDFNTDLGNHLQEMYARRAPDCSFVFPSPRWVKKDVAVTSFNMSIRKLRTLAGVPDFHAHSCRHYFISKAVMAGLDYMTIASWVGHKDGGILIGKVYGHLASEHKKRMAQRLSFGEKIVEEVA